ncbi:MAG: hypothetical protein ACXWJE_04945 [Burkholderiaceae bacterium]
MSQDIVIVRDNNEYRLLHGHLHLINKLSKCSEIFIEIKDVGKVKVMKTAAGFMVNLGNQSFPLLRI